MPRASFRRKFPRFREPQRFGARNVAAGPVRGVARPPASGIGSIATRPRTPLAVALHRVQGRLVIRMEPGVRARPGMALADASGREVGRIADLFGPVRRPYGIVYPRGEAKPGPLYAGRATFAARLQGVHTMESQGREHAKTAARTIRRPSP